MASHTVTQHSLLRLKMIAKVIKAIYCELLNLEVLFVGVVQISLGCLELVIAVVVVAVGCWAVLMNEGLLSNVSDS